jgi:sterol desaturase/sphingolipid hydroxylase (fatty acid hydroxylase superfamily)
VTKGSDPLSGAAFFAMLGQALETLRELRENLPPIALDILRLSIWLLLLMAIFAPLEKLFAANPQKIFRKGSATDLAYYFLNGLLPQALITLAMAAIAWALYNVTPSAIHLWAAGLPLPARLGAAWVVGELGFYWGHRWMHEIPVLWRFHSIHHSAEEIDWLVSARAHPLDMVFVRLCGLVPMYAMGLAQPLAGRRLDVAPLLILLTGSMWGYFIHANVRWRLGWLEWLISSPNFHHWHHAKDDHINKNYASMMPWLDKLFGTWYMPKKQWPAKYGTDYPVPAGLAGQLLHPFMPQDREPDAAVLPSTSSTAHGGLS